MVCKQLCQARISFRTLQNSLEKNIYLTLSVSFFRSEETCEQQLEYLSAPWYFDSLGGRSCSETQQYMEENDEWSNMLCALSIGELNLATYNTLIVPYCTQDVHTGDSKMQYSDDITVYHHGAHNLMAIARYIFKNFKNPSHIIITGCSAGGTALPLVYALMDQHYNRFKRRTTQISVIADSSVYLTPSYFLENVLDKWNPWTLAEHLGFDYKQYKYDTDYPTIYLDYILNRGSDKDRWGFVGHVDDPISEMFYQWMSGDGGDDERRQLSNSTHYIHTERHQQIFSSIAKRMLENNNNDDLAEEWWGKLSTSLGAVTSAHSNVDTFWIDSSSAHCTFGLYYALLEDGFEEWAYDILREQNLLSRPSLGYFMLSLLAGGFLAYGAMAAKRQERTMESGDYIKHEDFDPSKRSPVRSVFLWLEPFSEYPCTAAYMAAITIFFFTMICARGFAHPVNNPALGPTAIELSSFGINNPSLVVYKSEIFRILTSAFLCSGFLTWLITIGFLWYYARPLEQTIGWLCFGLLLSLLILGINIIYDLVGNGASCASLAIALGLNASSLSLRRKNNPKYMLVTMTILVAMVASVVFAFNSWVMNLTALVLGPALSLSLFNTGSGHAIPEKGAYSSQSDVTLLRTKRFYIACGTMILLFVPVVTRLRKPSALYVEPFYTGCDLKYSDQVGEIASQYLDDEGRRLREENDDGNVLDLCAQFCVPNLLSKAATYGAQKVMNLSVVDGTCEERGYEDHFVDKTFKYSSYSLDVEIFR